jgi:hypothetical protein
MALATLPEISKQLREIAALVSQSTRAYWAIMHLAEDLAEDLEDFKNPRLVGAASFNFRDLAWRPNTDGDEEAALLLAAEYLQLNDEDWEV